MSGKYNSNNGEQGKSGETSESMCGEATMDGRQSMPQGRADARWMMMMQGVGLPKAAVEF